MASDDVTVQFNDENDELVLNWATPTDADIYEFSVTAYNPTTPVITSNAEFVAGVCGLRGFESCSCRDGCDA